MLVALVVVIPPCFHHPVTVYFFTIGVPAFVLVFLCFPFFFAHLIILTITHSAPVSY